MLRIALCDDQPSSNDHLKEQLLLYADKKKVDFQITVFENPSVLFASMSETAFDIVFMDLSFDSVENDGILWSIRINQNFPDTLVLILTAYESRFKEGYVARAYRFMTKPLIWQELKENMDSCLRELDSAQSILIQPHGIPLKLTVQDILYLEAHAGGSRIYTTGNAYYCDKSLLQWENELPDEYFFRCHKKYLISLSHIELLNNHCVQLSQGRKLPVSRRKWTVLREKYMKFDLARHQH